MDLQSRTAFPVDLSLPRDNTGIWPKAAIGGAGNEARDRGPQSHERDCLLAMSPTRSFFVLAVACALAGTFVSAQQQATDSDLKEIAAYRLTSENLKKFLNVMRAMTQVVMQDPNIQEELKIDAELAAVAKKQPRTEADEEYMDELEARKARLERATLNPLRRSDTLGEMEAEVRKDAPTAQTLRREGMTPREFATFWMALFHSGLAYERQKSGQLKELPKGFRSTEFWNVPNGCRA
jgi:hypothetical protein